MHTAAAQSPIVASKTIESMEVSRPSAHTCVLVTNGNLVTVESIPYIIWRMDQVVCVYTYRVY